MDVCGLGICMNVCIGVCGVCICRGVTVCVLD